MTVRRRRRVNKLRGKRFHGHGNTKNARGKGARGVMGRAGSHKHKFTSYWMTFGVKVTLNPKPNPKALNLADFVRLLPKWIAEKRAERRCGQVLVDGKKVGIGKMLGRGAVAEKLVLSNIAVSEGAKEKIVEAGGSVGGEAASSEEDEEFEAEEEGAEEAEGAK